MKFQFSSNITLFTVLMAAVLIASYFLWLRHFLRTTGPGRGMAMNAVAWLRALTALMLIVLLFNVGMHFRGSEEEYAGIWFLWDRTASMSSEFCSADMPNDVLESSFYGELASQAELKHFSVDSDGVRAYAGRPEKPDETAMVTDISNMLREVENVEREGFERDIILVSDGQSHIGRDIRTYRGPVRINTIGVGDVMRSGLPRIDEFIFPEPAFSGDSLRLSVLIRNNGADGLHGSLHWIHEEKLKKIPLDLPPEFTVMPSFEIGAYDRGEYRGEITYISETDSVKLDTYILPVTDRDLKVWADVKVFDPDHAALLRLFRNDESVNIINDTEPVPDIALIFEDAQETPVMNGLMRNKEILKIVFSRTDKENDEIADLRLQVLSSFTLTASDLEKSREMWGQLPPLKRSNAFSETADILVSGGGAGKWPLIQWDGDNRILYLNGRGFWRWERAGYGRIWQDLYRKMALNILREGRKKNAGKLIFLRNDIMEAVAGGRIVIPYELSDQAGGGRVRMIIRNSDGSGLRSMEQSTGPGSGGYFSFSIAEAGDYDLQFRLEQDTELLDLDSMRLVVKENLLERQYTGLNAAALRELAENNRGQFISLDTLDRVDAADLLREVKREWAYIYQPASSRVFILLIFALAAVEWIIRKWKGQL